MPHALKCNQHLSLKMLRSFITQNTFITAKCIYMIQVNLWQKFVEMVEKEQYWPSSNHESYTMLLSSYVHHKQKVHYLSLRTSTKMSFNMMTLNIKKPYDISCMGRPFDKVTCMNIPHVLQLQQLECHSVWSIWQLKYVLLKKGQLVCQKWATGTECS